MKNLLCTLIFLLVVKHCIAQIPFPYHSLNPSWEMDRYSPYLAESIHVKLGQDTLFCGNAWNSVDFFDTNNYFIERIGFCRQENKKVFVRETANCNDAEFLMYDFNVKEGDSLYCGVDYGFGTLPTLMHIGYVGTGWYDGVPRKYISVTYQPDPFFPPSHLTWVEGVGDIDMHPFYSLECDGCDEDFNYNFNCLKLNDALVYNYLFSFNPCVPTIDTIYVNQNLIGGNNNGIDWDNAFYDLQDALSISDSGDVILVAQGIYFPTSGDDRTASFLMPRGVSLYGGFLGDETAISQRDFVANPTILSGDIGMAGENADNSYHVLFSLGADSSTVIDGFIIEKGMANHPNFSNLNGRGGGYYLGTNNFNTETDPSIRNCIFRENVGRRGGAIYCDGRIGHQVLNSISDCQFTNNLAMSEGGAIYKRGGESGLVSKLENCEFIENHAFSGGAIYMTEILGAQVINDCIFNQDTAHFEGGAIYIESSLDSVDFYFKNSLFVGNKSNSGGAISSIYTGNPPNYSLNYIVDSCHFESNYSSQSGGGAIVFANTGNISKLEIKHSTFSDNVCRNGGGAILIGNSYGSFNSLKIESCIFNNNFTENLSGAGAVFYSGFSNDINPLGNQTEINNSLFYKNGGALAFLNGGLLGTVDAKINNCTFFANGNFPIDKNWDEDFNDVDYYNNMEITNSIFWEHTPIEKLFYNNNFTDFTIHDYVIKNCLVSVPDCIVDGVDACSEGMIYEEYPMFLDTLNNDFRLLGCSPAVNAGNNDFLNPDNIFDLNQQMRVLDSIVDMGAYEQELIDIQIFVSVVNATTVNSSDGVISIDSITGGATPYSIQWETGDTTNHLDNIPYGEYQVVVTDGEGCSETLTIEVSASNAVSEGEDAFELIVFPNPADQFIYVEFAKATNDAELELYNQVGHQLLQTELGSKNKINIAGIGPGLYFIKVRSGGKVIIRSVVNI